jgi:hypothetical protein
MKMNMINAITAFTLSIFLTLNTSLGQANSGGELLIQKYYEIINSTAIDGDTNDMISLLTEFDHLELWGFGAGLGPTDSESMQLTAIQAFYKRLCNDDGLPLPELKQTIVQNNAFLAWRHHIMVDPKDSEALSNLLLSGKPAVRWLGLKKASSLSLIGREQIDILRSIAMHDPYVRIIRINQRKEMDRPSPPGKTVNEFACPFRDMAHDILLQHGVNAKKDEISISNTGISYLDHIYSHHKNKRQDIIDAIMLLYKDGNSVAVLKQLKSTVTIDDDNQTMFKAIAPLIDN